MEKLVKINGEAYIAFSFYDILNLLENSIYQAYYQRTGDGNDYLDEVVSDLMYEYMEKMRYGKFIPMKEENILTF